MLPNNKNALTVFWNSTRVSKITGEKETQKKTVQYVYQDLKSLR